MSHLHFILGSLLCSHQERLAAQNIRLSLTNSNDNKLPSHHRENGCYHSDGTINQPHIRLIYSWCLLGFSRYISIYLLWSQDGKSSHLYLHFDLWTMGKFIISCWSLEAQEVGNSLHGLGIWRPSAGCWAPCFIRWMGLKNPANHHLGYYIKPW